jgi:hypothetical protein
MVEALVHVSMFSFNGDNLLEAVQAESETAKTPAEGSL